jgi:transposase
LPQYLAVCIELAGSKPRKETGMSQDTKMTVGLDVGDRFSRYCVLDAEGRVVAEGRVPTSAEALRRQFTEFSHVRVVLEVGTHSPWISRLLEGLGHEVLVANARQVKLIYASHTKSDRLDAERLARLGRLDPKVLAPIRHRGAVAQADLAVLRARAALVEARTKLVNHVRSAVKSFGGRLAKCSTHTFARAAAGKLPDVLRPALDPLVRQIEQLSAAIRGMDRQVEQLGRDAYPATARLQQVAGVGPQTSLAFVLTLEDPGRFPKSRTVGSYLGLRPRQSDSGEQEPQLRITKAGDGMLRALLIECAHYILGPHGPDCDLRRCGERIAARGGKSAKKKARVAVARKLAVLLHRLWVTGEPYDPLRNGKRSEVATVATT